MEDLRETTKLSVGLFGATVCTHRNLSNKSHKDYHLSQLIRT